LAPAKEEALFMEGVYSYGTGPDNFAGQQNWEPPAGREPKAEGQDGPSQ